jgi:hypothetical protein
MEFKEWSKGQVRVCTSCDKAFKEARKGYVNLSDVLNIINNPDCIFCKQLQIEKNGNNNQYYCNENECETFKISEIKKLGELNE